LRDMHEVGRSSLKAVQAVERRHGRDATSDTDTANTTLCGVEAHAQRGEDGFFSAAGRRRRRKRKRKRRRRRRRKRRRVGA
jgi:hypothetical protein